MIETIELAGRLDYHYLFHILYHTYSLCIALRIATDTAYIAVGDIVTHLAVFHLLTQPYETLSQPHCSVRLLTQQVQDEPKRSLSAYARQFRKFVNCISQEL